MGEFTLERDAGLALSLPPMGTAATRTAAPRLTVAVAEDRPVMREGLAALRAGEGAVISYR